MSKWWHDVHVTGEKGLLAEIGKTLGTGFHAARVRGIAIYDRGRRVSVRQVSGAVFQMNDWLSFPDFTDE